MNDSSAILLSPSPQRQARVKTTIGDLGTLRLESSVTHAIATANATGARILLVDFCEAPETALGWLEAFNHARPGSQLVAIAANKDPELILRAMRAGAREFVLLDDADELRRIFRDLVHRTSAAKPAGKIISVFPAKGGMGATAIAANLAGALLEGDKRVIVVDLDLQLGDVLVFLDMASRYTVADVLHNLQRLDRDLLTTSLARHPSGVYVLAQSDHIEEAEQVSAGQIGSLLQFLARHFDYVICDGLRGFDEMSLAALDASNKILLVLTQDVPAIKNAQRCLGVLKRLGYDDAKVKLVLNRFQKSEKIDLPAISENLGYPVDAVVSNDYPSVIRAINRGELFRDAAPRSRILEDIERLARSISGTEQRPVIGKRKGLFSGFFGRADSTDAAGTSEAEPAGAAEKDPNEPKRAPEAV